MCSCIPGERSSSPKITKTDMQDDLEFWGIDDSILDTCCRDKYERELEFVLHVLS